jgi:3',5'-cyclic AMP phosphodiesterase CpdA
MRIVHITDPHLSTLSGQSLRTLSIKRCSGYLSWTRRRRHIHLPQTLQGLITAVRGESADQIVLTGDLVQIGLADEIREVSGWLAELAPAKQVFYVPGNHDVYAPDSWAAQRQYWHSVLPAPLAGTEDTSHSGYPLVRDIGNIRLIGASSACVTPVFSARGAVGAGQLQRLAEELGKAREQGRMPCLAIHHPPLPGMAPWRKALREVKALKAMIATFQPALVWCGHLHHNRAFRERESRIFCTASASCVHHAAYRVFDIEPGVEGAHRGWGIHTQLKSSMPGTDRFLPVNDQRWHFRL